MFDFFARASDILDLIRNMEILVKLAKYMELIVEQEVGTEVRKLLKFLSKTTTLGKAYQKKKIKKTRRV